MASSDIGGVVAQFERMLRSCGVDINEGRAISVSVDRREFHKRLRQTLVTEKIAPAELADAAKIYFSKEAIRFENGLAVCDPAISSTVSSLWPARQNSVLCLLLSVPQIQRDLLKFVLDTLYERALGDENSASVTYGVIQALKWQDTINDPEALIQRIFELIADVPEEQQRQLVRALPEMLREEGSHATVAAHLCDLYENHSELSGAVLEALAALRVPSDVVVSVRKSVLSSIPQLDVEQLCPVLDFVLRNLPEADIPVFVNLLRSSEAIVLASQEPVDCNSHEPVDHTTASAQADALIQFVDKLRVGVMTHRALGECWLKMIEVNSAGACLKQIDVVFLFVCYRQLHQRHADATIRQAVKEACLTESVTSTVLKRHQSLLRRHLNNILEICDLLLRGPVISMHELASAIYRELFLYYDVHVQTEVIVALLTHAGSGSPAELHNALSCVHILCTKHVKKTAPFGFMLQVLLDQLGRMSLGQARLLFRSLAWLAYADADADIGLRDTLRIAARKQLINPNLKYKCVGMVATVAMVEAMLPKRSSTSANPSNLHNDSSLRSASVQMVIDIGRLSSVLDRSQKVGLPIEAMCPLFRLLRAAEIEIFSTDLQGINALLFARTLPDDFEDINLSVAPDKEQLLISLFHTINWNRELINSASELMSRDLRAQLVKTIRKQVNLINLAAQWLARLPEFVPPRVTFEDGVSAQSVHVRTAVKAKAGKGRKRKANEEETDDNAATKNSVPVEFASFRHFLRSLNQNFVYLLEEDFLPTERAFLLQELWSQLDASLGTEESQRVFLSPAALKKENTASRQPPEEMVRFLINFIPQLSSLLEALVDKMKVSSGHVHNSNDQDTYMDNSDSALSSDEILCLRLLFSIFNTLLSWRGFNEPRNAKVLRQALNMIALRVGSTQFRTQCDVVEFHRRVFGYFVELATSVADLETAAALLQLLLTVLDKTASNADANKRRLLGVAEEFLRRDWPRSNKDKSARIAKSAQTLMTVYIEETDDRLEKIAYLSETVFPELSGNARSTIFPIIARDTLTACYKTIASYFVRSVKAMCGAQADGQDRLTQWLRIAKTLRLLLDVVKISATNLNASCGLKTACETLDVFIKYGMAVAETSFKARTDEVLLLVKTLQQSTRVMQHTCSHFKTNAAKQIALARQVPTARRLLETFIFKIQALFSKFNCADALQVGQLRMRNLRGEEISNSKEEDDQTEDMEDAGDEESFNGDDDDDDDDDEQEQGGELNNLASRLNTTDESAEF
ncbi:Fanconi anemia group D2 protein-like isoform X2 [Varroa jacobsoni]|uniref:Fanconi anemia group D2 protein-like isoform X2 n=1 Tax=Varroa jacobsoni TaxID=62625 RepID=UPI000BF86308|nr:Fanconi anemia group D2 protein-like isoform X2 [Varroa jacobsoni]